MTDSLSLIRFSLAVARRLDRDYGLVPARDFTVDKLAWTLAFIHDAHVDGMTASTCAFRIANAKPELASLVSIREVMSK